MDEQPDPGSFLIAFVVVLLVPFFTAVLAAVDVRGFDTLLLYIGAFQLLWIVPAWIIARRKRKTESAKGIIAGACLVVLLNGVCAGLLR